MGGLPCDPKYLDDAAIAGNLPRNDPSRQTLFEGGALYRHAQRNRGVYAFVKKGGPYRV
jgi:hypothetical protein